MLLFMQCYIENVLLVSFLRMVVWANDWFDAGLPRQNQEGLVPEPECPSLSCMGQWARANRERRSEKERI